MFGVPPAQPYPVRVRLKFGNGRVNQARFAAGIPAGIGGGRGEFSAFPMDADVPVSLRKGSLESSYGQLGFRRISSTSERLGIEVS